MKITRDESQYRMVVVCEDEDERQQVWSDIDMAGLELTLEYDADADFGLVVLCADLLVMDEVSDLIGDTDE